MEVNIMLVTVLGLSLGAATGVFLVAVRSIRSLQEDLDWMHHRTKELESLVEDYEEMLEEMEDRRCSRQTRRCE